MRPSTLRDAVFAALSLFPEWEREPRAAVTAVVVELPHVAASVSAKCVGIERQRRACASGWLGCPPVERDSGTTWRSDKQHWTRCRVRDREAFDGAFPSAVPAAPPLLALRACGHDGGASCAVFAESLVDSQRRPRLDGRALVAA